MGPWLERQRHFLDFTLASLARRKGKNLSLLAVYTLVVFIVSSAILFTQAVHQEAGKVLAGAPALVVQRIKAGRHDFTPASYLEAIGAIPGVSQVKGRLWGYYYDPVAKANYTVMAPGNQGLAAGQTALGSGLARLLGVSAGDSISLTSHQGRVLVFKIKRILPAASDLVSADLVLITPAAFRRLFGVAEHLFTDLTVEVRNPQEIATVARKIVELFPAARPILREELLRTYTSLFDWRSGLLLVVLSGALLAFLIFAWDKATGMQAEERMEIGVLKAVGWETSDVLAMKFWEAVVISLSAFLLGFILAYIHIFFASAALIGQAIKGWSVLYPSYRLTPYLDAQLIGLLFLLTVFPYTFLTIIPSWRVAITDPDLVMRR